MQSYTNILKPIEAIREAIIKPVIFIRGQEEQILSLLWLNLILIEVTSA
jgi:hypothetical protein